MRNYKSTTGTYAGNHQKLHYVASRRAWVPLVYGLLDARPLIPPDPAWASAIRGKQRGIRLVSDPAQRRRYPDRRPAKAASSCPNLDNAGVRRSAYGEPAPGEQQSREK